MKNPLLKTLLVCLLPVLLAGTGRASWDISSNIDLTARIFTEDPRWEGQDDSTVQYSIAGTLDARWRGGGGTTIGWSLALIGITACVVIIWSALAG